MQPDAHHIGRKIARLRYQKGWTQDTLVARLQVLQSNITRDILANIELRRSLVKANHCCFIAKALAVARTEKRDTRARHDFPLRCGRDAGLARTVPRC